MRILITGSRDWTDRDLIKTALYFSGASTVVTGACPTGADALAEEIAEFYGLEIERHPADWSLGRRAGPLRNQHMVNLGADMCLAFIKDHSRGATGCANMAEAAGIRTFRYTA